MRTKLSILFSINLDEIKKRIESKPTFKIWKRKSEKQQTNIKKKLFKNANDKVRID